MLIKSTFERFYVAALSGTVAILQMKPKHTEAKSLAQGHTANKAKL